MNVMPEGICPTAPCGLPAFSVTHPPVCYSFDFGSGCTSPRPDSECTAPAPPSSVSCPASATAACLTEFSYCQPPNGNRPNGRTAPVGNGRAIASARSLSACRDACTAEPTCVAIDVVFGSQCYLKSAAPASASGSGGGFQFVWRTDGPNVPPNCVNQVGMLPRPLECVGTIRGCETYDAAGLAQGTCSCATCTAVPNCASMSSGTTCMCERCADGYVTDSTGHCMQPSANALTEVSSVHPIGARVAMSKGYHPTTQRNGWKPRRMQSASCNDGTVERFFVAWDSTEPRGYLAEFEVAADGTSTLISNRAQPTCEEMGDVTATADCSVIAVLCQSSHGRNQEINVRTYPSNVIDFQARSGRFGWGWTNDSPPMPLDRQLEMWLHEYTGGTTNVGTPAAQVVVNKAIGGAPIGNYALRIDATGSRYLVDVKATTGTHEGSLGFGITRNGWAHDTGLTTGWACGTGHTIGNRLTYNPVLNTWARMCWTDNNVRNAAEPNGPYAGSYLFAWFFRTIPSGGSNVQISALPTARYNQDSPGGPQSIISLGASGWMAVGFAPVGLDAQSALPQDSTPRTSRQMALAINVLPANSNDCGGGSTAASGRCTWNFLTGLPGRSVWNYDGTSGGLGYVNIEKLQRDDEFLVGYTTNINHRNTHALALNYHVAKVTKDGTFVQAMTLATGGWGEDDVWTRLSNGCVAFPHVGIARIGSSYSTGATGADTMRITVVCD